jgi:hypothetical protein
MTIDDSITLMKQETSRLAPPVPLNGMPPMTFACTFSEDAAVESEMAALDYDCPSNLREFWSKARTAKLFEDQQYGQWGLEILSPNQAADVTKRFRTQRVKDFIDGDLVIGQFLGDSDLLIIRCNAAESDFGSILVALPIDPRAGWYKVAESFAIFLDTYAKAGGEKFWTKQR